MSLVIIGGGVVGLAIAYYASLSDPSRRIIIVDSEKSLFLSASGFSGGFIVRDWFSSSVLPLADLSFRLHQELAESHDGRNQWGYTPSIGYSLVMDQQGPDGDGTKKVRGEDWLLHGTSRADVARKYVSSANSTSNQQDVISQPQRRDPLLRPDGSPTWANIPTGGVLEKISSPSGCAQVVPRQLCEWLLQSCRNRGVQVSLGTKPVALARRSSDGEIIGLLAQKKQGGGGVGRGVEEVILRCKDVVIAGGCWTPRIFETLVGKQMATGIRPLPGYSVVVRSPRYSRPILEADALGRSVETSHSIFCPPTVDWNYSPEAMARQTRDGKPEIYVAGLNNEEHRLPELAGQSKDLMDRALMDDLRRTAVKLVGRGGQDDTSPQGESSDLEIVREALCFRPVSENGLPIISRVDGINTNEGGGLYVASGHGPWGITLSLATGLVVSEVLRGVQPSVPLDDFHLKSDVSAPLRPRL